MPGLGSVIGASPSSPYAPTVSTADSFHVNKWAFNMVSPSCVWLRMSPLELFPIEDVFRNLISESEVMSNRKAFLTWVTYILWEFWFRASIPSSTYREISRSGGIRLQIQKIELGLSIELLRLSYKVNDRIWIHLTSSVLFISMQIRVYEFLIWYLPTVDFIT